MGTNPTSASLVEQLQGGGTNHSGGAGITPVPCKEMCDQGNVSGRASGGGTPSGPKAMIRKRGGVNKTSERRGAWGEHGLARTYPEGWSVVVKGEQEGGKPEVV